MTVVWGDGTATTMATVNPDGTFSATHTYADNPPTGTTYGVTLTVADDDGASVSIKRVDRGSTTCRRRWR